MQVTKVSRLISAAMPERTWEVDQSGKEGIALCRGHRGDGGMPGQEACFRQRFAGDRGDALARDSKTREPTLLQ